MVGEYGAIPVIRSCQEMGCGCLTIRKGSLGRWSRLLGRGVCLFACGGERVKRVEAIVRLKGAVGVSEDGCDGQF